MIGRKLLQIISLPLIMLLQASCSAVQSQPAATPELSGTPFSSQKFTVIPVYEGIASYAEAVRAASHPDWNALFRQFVVDPYWQDCAAGGDLLNKDAATTPIKDIDYLTTAVSALRESHVEQVIQDALQKAAKALPGPNTTVCILVADSQPTFVKDYMNGVLGSNVGAGKIWLQIYPSGAWLDWIPYTVTHEYHHTVWLDQQGSQLKTGDLVDHLIVEGRADSFARLLYPDLHAPWTEALAPEQERNQWQDMQHYLNAHSSDTQQKFMMGGLVGSNHVPLWTGYTIGFHIVQSYLQEHPAVTIDEWTMMDAHDLLDQSGYDRK